MIRRNFLHNALVGSGAAALGLMLSKPNISDIKVKKVSFYAPPDYSKPLMAQSRGIVVVECDNGLKGIGEGGSRDTIENLAGWLIGQDPMLSEHLWQLMLRGYFYPGGRELQHAMGALDMALWDIKGKILQTPIYNLLGGKLRKHIECYSTGYPSQGTIGETAKHCVESGFKAFRTGGVNDTGVPWNVEEQVRKVYKTCEEIKKGVDGKGEWAIDFHTRFEKPHAIRLANLIEEFDPLFVEDLIRSENQALYKTLRRQVNVPIALGEQFGIRWDFHRLVEEDLMDYCRVTLPNCAGITEYKKIMSMCETHYVGMVPHFTGPIATAALTHCVSTFTGQAIMEVTGTGPQPMSYLNSDYVDFKDGKFYPTDKPGIGVELDETKCEKIAEVTEAKNYEFSTFRRLDGSYTNW